MIKKISFLALVIFVLVVIANILVCAVAFSTQNYTVTTDFSRAKNLVQDEVVMLVVDFSDSMNEYLGDKKKIDIAMENLAAILPTIPANIKVGLRVYGHKHNILIYQACTASEAIVYPRQKSAGDISNALYSLAPKGVTPITYSLKKSIEQDFGAYQGKKHIILISDGKENCDESPCKYAIELMKTRDDVKIDVIALGIDDPDAVAQLKCAALTTGGKFFSSNTSAQLFDSLKDSFNAQKEVQGQIIIK